MVFAVANLKAMQIGTKSLTSAIANTALALSTIFFVVVWKNTITIFGIIGIINFVKGIILGVQVLNMTDEEFAEKKNTLSSGIPA